MGRPLPSCLRRIFIPAQRHHSGCRGGHEANCDDDANGYAWYQWDHPPVVLFASSSNPLAAHDTQEAYVPDQDVKFDVGIGYREPDSTRFDKEWRVAGNTIRVNSWSTTRGPTKTF